MRVLVAFDKFKDAVSAVQACAVAVRALAECHPTWTFDECPLTDGGDGFAPILTAAAGGELVHAATSDPLGRPLNAAFGLVAIASIPPAALARLSLSGPPRSGQVAIVEMAAASGLSLLTPDERDPWRTTSAGTGQLLRAAAAANPLAIVLGVGGSATNDLGLGALVALGLRPEPPDASPAPVAWERIERLTGAIASALPPIRIACDVDNPLLGPRGCVHAFGAQKGLRPDDAPRLERATARMAELLARYTGSERELMAAPGAGAAGGIAFGLGAALAAVRVGGSTLVAEWLGLDERIQAADLVITGEGSFDESSLEGKGAGAIAAQAAVLGRPVHVFAGRVAPGLENRPGVHAITPPEVPLATALVSTPALLRAAVQRHLG